MSRRRSIDPPEIRAARVSERATSIDVADTVLYEAINNGELTACRVGPRTLVIFEEDWTFFLRRNMTGPTRAVLPGETPCAADTQSNEPSNAKPALRKIEGGR